MVRTRIAPSPTGYPHIGTIYQALFDFAFAKKNGGQFVVRIEDTDRLRFVADAEEKLFSALDWFGLAEDESPRKKGPYEPYRQSERLELYQKYAEELILKGGAEYCYFPKEKSEQKSESLLVKPHSIHEMIQGNDWVLKLKIPHDTTIVVKDEVRGEVRFESKDIDSPVLIKSDGFPTYHFAVVVDDHSMEITHVVRGEEWISSFPKHKLIYDYFGWRMPLFFHTAVLRNPDKSKLSKRHSHTSVSWYKESGYLPQAILNFLALMGWSHPEGKEIFPLAEFVRLFDLKDIKPIGPIFDLTKLTWMNQQYIQKLSEDNFLESLEEFYSSDNIVLSKAKDAQELSREVKMIQILPENDTVIRQLFPLVRERMQTLKDFEVLAGHFFQEPQIVVNNEQEKEIAVDLMIGFTRIETWKKDEIFVAIKEVLNKYKIRMPILYRLLTGSEKGLPLPESIEILGKEKTLGRMSHIMK